MHYRRKMCKFSRRRGKLCPGAGKKSHSFTIEETCVGFPGAGGSCVPAPERSGARFCRGSGARLLRECRLSRRRGKLSPGAEKAVSRRRVNIEEKCVGFPGAEGSCAPAPGKLFPKKKVWLCRCWGNLGRSCVSAPGKLFPGAQESCVPVPKKAHTHAVSKKNVRFSRRWGKLRPGAFPAPWKTVSRRRESCFPASGKG